MLVLAGLRFSEFPVGIEAGTEFFVSHTDAFKQDIIVDLAFSGYPNVNLSHFLSFPVVPVTARDLFVEKRSGPKEHRVISVLLPGCSSVAGPFTSNRGGVVTFFAFNGDRRVLGRVDRECVWLSAACVANVVVHVANTVQIIRRMRFLKTFLIISL
jgi:hypothetical protein